MIGALAVTGWLVVAWLLVLLFSRKQPQPIDEPITHLLMVDASGWPESLRKARGSIPKEIPRVHGKDRKAERYHRTGTAAVYQVKG